MATSGTVSDTIFTTRKVVDHALRRCKIESAKITAEMQQIALDNLYLMLSSFSARGCPLWCQTKVLVGLTEGSANVTLPKGTIDVLDANIRQIDRLQGTPYMDPPSGSQDFAFDDNYDTTCDAGVNGTIGVDFGAADYWVTTVGVLFDGNMTTALEFEYSQDDGATWKTALSVASQEYVNLQWAWFDLPVQVYADAMQVRSTGGGTLKLREFYVGNNPSAIPLGRLNKDDYYYMPNKSFLGRPLQYWLDRQVDLPVMRIWPSCDNGSRENQFELLVRRYIMDVGTLRGTLEVPQRWFEAICWCLAWRLATELPEFTNMEWLNGVIKPQADISEAMMMAEESDNSPIRWVPDLSPYTS